jgi:hypothetical protein
MPDPFYRFNDKCHLTVDRDLLGMSPFANRIHVTWIKDGGASIGPWSDIFFAYSTNQGVAWSYPGGSAVPVPINDVPYVPLGNPPFDMANGPNVAVSPTGTVYVAWTQMDVTIPQSAGAIRLDRSYDGGVTWGTDITVQPGLLCCPANLTSALGADARARSFPCLAVSPLLNPQGLYDLYLVYPADPDGAGPDEADVFFTRSADDGATWSPPFRVNPDPTPFDQFQPWVRVKPNGWIDIAWYDRRNDPMDTMWEVVMTRSADRGMTFAPEVFLTVPGPFPTPHMTWGERWMGEYLGLGVDQTHAYVAFTTSMPDTAGDIYFASVHNFAMSTAAPELPGAEAGTALQLECPNPYRPEAAIRLTLPAPGRARLTIHDALGRLVKVLEDGERTAGQHVVTWDGRDRRGQVVAAGVYFLRLEAEGGRATEKIALLR